MLVFVLLLDLASELVYNKHNSNINVSSFRWPILVLRDAVSGAHRPGRGAVGRNVGSAVFVCTVVAAVDGAVVAVVVCAVVASVVVVVVVVVPLSIPLKKELQI